jgi:hypothetical protein
MRLPSLILLPLLRVEAKGQKMVVKVGTAHIRGKGVLKVPC